MMGGVNDKGYPAVNQSAAIGAERRRVRELLARDRADRQAEQYRAEARTRFENGDSASSADAVIPPTPEWLAKGDVEGFIPHQDRNSTRLVKSVRRPKVPQARKMLAALVIEYSGLLACEWYADLYENTGFSGNIPSVDYCREVFAAPHSRDVFNDRQLDAQDTFRAVQEMINPRFLPLLNAIVLEDVPYYRAERLVKARKGKAKAFFGLAVEQLVEARKAVEA